MPDRWTAEQVLALAPDAGSAVASRALASPGKWSATGFSDVPPAVWGLCAGSGKQPYQTVVDLSEPAYRCSCPSRKFPCKHALGLLLLWSGGAVPNQSAPSDHAAAWLRDRSARAAKASVPSTPGTVRTPVDQRAAERRVELRGERVAGGVADLDQWLRDQVRTGLAGVDRAGYRHFDQVAARLVDAQAPGLAGAVRRLASVAASGVGWPGRLLEAMALLRLLVAAHPLLDQLPADLAATVRTRIGYPNRVDDVLATAPVRDWWDVLALVDRGEDRLTTRRVHLRGAQSGRSAIVLSFAPAGQALDASLVPGTSIEADLHFYPGAVPLRAVVGERHAEPAALSAAAGLTVGDALDGWAGALAADPWTTEWPVLLAEVVPVPATDGTTTGWRLVDATGTALPLLPSERLWTLLAVAGGHPVSVAADLTPGGLRASSVRADGELVAL